MEDEEKANEIIRCLTGRLPLVEDGDMRWSRKFLMGLLAAERAAASRAALERAAQAMCSACAGEWPDIATTPRQLANGGWYHEHIPSGYRPSHPCEAPAIRTLTVQPESPSGSIPAPEKES